MKQEQRKAAVAAYKQREVDSGIYVIRCAASSQTWVGSAPDLATIQNRHWFGLRHNSHPNRALQAAWAAHGPASFAFEIAERIDPDTPDFARSQLLKDLLELWAEQLAAARL